MKKCVSEPCLPYPARLVKRGEGAQAAAGRRMTGRDGDEAAGKEAGTAAP